MAIRQDNRYIVCGCFDGSVYVIDCRAMKVGGRKRRRGGAGGCQPFPSPGTGVLLPRRRVHVGQSLGRAVGMPGPCTFLPPISKTLWGWRLREACCPPLGLQLLHKLAGHSDRVTRVSCQGDAILSGSFDGNVCLWQF